MSTDEKLPELPAEAQTSVAPWADPLTRRALVEALRRGDRDGLLQAFGITANTTSDRVKRMAELLIEWRRMTVSTIGAHEVFFRRTEAGDLKQVVAPVKLSVADGTLYRMPAKHERRLKDDPSRFAPKSAKPWEVQWVPVYDDPREARLTAAGYNKLNEVAGCSVAMPSTVAVDGHLVQNPHVHRNEHGDLKRITLQVNVAGPAPMTGNIVVVQYVLDLDVEADLRQMLMNVAKGQGWKNKRDDKNPDAPIDGDVETGGSDPVQLVPRAAFDDFRQSKQGYWHWLPLYGGVGLAHNLSHPAVRSAYDKQIAMLDNAYRKAQTIARRNAMRMHPALSQQVVQVDPNRLECTVRAIGWTMADADTARYTRALDELARGEVAPDVEVVEHRHTYDPVGDNERPLTIEDTDEVIVEEEEIDAATEEKNTLRQKLDELVLDLPGRVIRDIGYPPGADATFEDLATMCTAAEKHLRRPEGA